MFYGRRYTILSAAQIFFIYINLIGLLFLWGANTPKKSNHFFKSFAYFIVKSEENPIEVKTELAKHTIRIAIKLTVFSCLNVKQPINCDRLIFRQDLLKLDPINFVC